MRCAIACALTVIWAVSAAVVQAHEVRQVFRAERFTRGNTNLVQFQLSENTNGLARVLVAPNPGGLKFVKAAAPTPKGVVYVDLKFLDGKAFGTVVLSPGLEGDFEWNGARTPLKSGMNEFIDPARTKPLAAIPRTNQGLFIPGIRHRTGGRKDTRQS